MSIYRGSVSRVGGRWGGRATTRAGTRDLAGDSARMATDPPVSEAQRKAMHAAASGHSTIGIPESVGKEFADADKGGKLPQHAHDGSRFEMRYIAAESEKPWHVVDSEDDSVKKFATQEEAENHVLSENRAALLKERDDRERFRQH